MAARSRGKLDTGRVATLDGLRGIAVLFVVVGHAYDTLKISSVGFGKLIAPVHDSTYGVLIFFVLSGYLITGILTKEGQSAGRPNLRRFYTRRALRIWPAFYTYLAVVAVLTALSVVKLSGASFLSAGLFVWNYSPAAKGWWLDHTWSLAVEEQFYLLWPLLLVWLRPKRAFRLAIVVVALVPFVRTAQYLVVPATRGRLGSQFHTRVDALLIGSLLALLPVVYPALRVRLSALMRRRAQCLLIAAFIFLVHPLGEAFGGGGYMLTVGWTMAAVAVALFIVFLVDDTQSHTTLHRALASPVLVWFGLISYSLYLWQQLFCTVDNHSFTGIFGVNIALAIGFAFASRKLVEEPFLRRKRQFEFHEEPGGAGRPEPSVEVAPPPQER